MRIKSKLLFIVITSILVSCGDAKTNNVCNSGLYKKVENLIYGNEYVVNSEDYYIKPELRAYLSIIKDINDLKYAIIVASGGIDPKSYDIINGCRFNGEKYHDIYIKSAVFSKVNGLESNEEVDGFEETFNKNLDVFFNESKMFTKEYFIDNTTTTIALDISFIELEMYGVLFYHHPHCY